MTSKEILTVVKTSKLWIALKTEPTIPISSIITNIGDNTIDIIAYRVMNGPPEERMWRDHSGEALGRAGIKFNSPSVRKLDNLGTGIASLLYDKALRKIEAQRKRLLRPIGEIIKRAESETPSCSSTPSCTNTTKKGGTSTSAAATPIVEITLRGTPAEIFTAMREILAGAILGESEK